MEHNFKYRIPLAQVPADQLPHFELRRHTYNVFVVR